MTEQEVQKSILDYLKFQQLWCQKIQSGMAMGLYTQTIIKLADAGTPDILCATHPVTVDGWLIHPLGFIEVKKPGGVLSDVQIARLRALHKAQHRWLVAISVDDVIKWLADPRYHGQQKYVDDVLNEAKKFIPTEIKRKKAKMTMSTFLAHDRWAQKNEDEPAPF